MIVKQILLVSTLGNVWRIVWRICMSECKGLNTEIANLLFWFYCTITWQWVWNHFLIHRNLFRNNFKRPAGIHKHNQIFIPAWICAGVTYYWNWKSYLNLVSLGMRKGRDYWKMKLSQRYYMCNNHAWFHC